MPPTNNKYGATAWGNKYLEDLEMPSGQLCQVRRPGLEGLMREGVLPRIDKLTDLVDKKHVKRVREGKMDIGEIDIASLAVDQDQLMELLDVCDKVVEAVVVQPSVLRPIIRDQTGKPVLDPEGKEQILPPGMRDPEQVYTDYVDAQDRMFIFNYAVGGSRDLESFRDEIDKLAGSVGAGENVESPAQ